MKHITSSVHEQLSDLTTPVGVYLRVREQYPITLLLESSDYESKENSFSFIAFEPISSIKIDKDTAVIDGQLIDLKQPDSPNVSNLLNSFYQDVSIDYQNPNAKKIQWHVWLYLL